MSVMEEITPLQQRRFAIVLLGEDTLRQMFQLPESAIIMGVHADFPRQSVQVMVCDPSFEPVPDGAEPPLIVSGIKVERCEDDPDFVHVHVSWGF